jgi:hypothetical protein
MDGAQAEQWPGNARAIPVWLIGGEASIPAKEAPMSHVLAATVRWLADAGLRWTDVPPPERPRNRPPRRPWRITDRTVAVGSRRPSPEPHASPWPARPQAQIGPTLIADPAQHLIWYLLTTRPGETRPLGPAVAARFGVTFAHQGGGGGRPAIAILVSRLPDERFVVHFEPTAGGGVEAVRRSVTVPTAAEAAQMVIAMTVRPHAAGRLLAYVPHVRAQQAARATAASLWQYVA